MATVVPFSPIQPLHFTHQREPTMVQAEIVLVQAQHADPNKVNDNSAEFQKIIQHIHTIQYQKHEGDQGRDYRNPQNLDYGDCLKKKTYRHLEKDVYVECTNIRIPRSRMTQSQPFRSLRTSEIRMKQEISTQRALLIYKEDLGAFDFLRLRVLADQPVQLDDLNPKETKTSSTGSKWGRKLLQLGKRVDQQRC